MAAIAGEGVRKEDQRPPILVVDDEVSIRKALDGVLADAGYQVLLAENGQAALNILRTIRPSLVILDIWMPGIDGIEILKKIKEIYADLPVIMISGHATIATAIKATKLGAFDFVEKPLDLHATLDVVSRALSREQEEGFSEDSVAVIPDEHGQLAIGRTWEASQINAVVFKDQKLRGRSLQQKTLARSVVLYGQGLHSGRKSGLILEPLPANSGIHFVGVSETTVVPAHVDFVESTGFATTLKLGGTQVATIEHIMSCLRAYGISNLLVKCNGEVPVMDGSAQEFCDLIEETGVFNQDGDWFEIEVRKTYQVGKGKEFIRLEPCDHCIIDYTLDYPEPLGRQRFEFVLTDSKDYRDLIAPARTFGFVRDIGYLQKQGLAQGGRFDNFVLYGDEGPINAELRFADEAVRHKILDIIGDLYLLGRPIRARLTAAMTGHSDNVELLKLLGKDLV